MSVKVKRGLGLLVGAVLAWLALWGIGHVNENGSGNGALDVLQAAAVVVLLLALIVSVVGGLVLIAWGLLATRGSRRPASGPQD